MFTRILVTAATAAIIVTTALAGSVVGTWHGKVTLDMSKMPKARNAQEQAQMTAAIAGIKKIRLEVTFNANHTYKGHSTDPTGKPVDSDGTWVQKGSQVTLTPQKHNGKPVTGVEARPKVYTQSKDGKTLFFLNRGAKVIFTK
jgi:hypothetical protein